VWGGGSGVGQAAVSLLKLAGFVEIIAVASSKHAEYLESRGATYVVDYREDDVVASIRGILAGKPLTKAIDAISTAESSELVMQLLAPGADLIYVLPDFDLPKRADVRSEFVFCGVFHGDDKKEDRAFGAGQVWPFIERLMETKVYPLQPQLVLRPSSDQLLDKFKEGLQICREGSSGGKKVVLVWPSP